MKAMSMSGKTEENYENPFQVQIFINNSTEAIPFAVFNSDVAKIDKSIPRYCSLIRKRKSKPNCRLWMKLKWRRLMIAVKIC